MRLVINGRNIDITQAIKDYVKEKIGRIVKHNDQILDMEVTLGVTKNPSVQNNHFAEVTCFLNGAKFHVKEEAESMYAAIDLLADKLDRQAKKHKEKLLKNKAGQSIRTNKTEALEEEESQAQDEDIVDIELSSEE